MQRLGAFIVLLLVLGLLVPSVTIQGSKGQIVSGTADKLWQRDFAFPSGTQDDHHDWVAPTVVDGVLYLGANTVVDGFYWLYPNGLPPGYSYHEWADFYAINATTSNVIWDYKVDDNSTRILTQGFVSDGMVFFGDSVSVLALNATDGTLVWNSTINQAIVDLTVANGFVYSIGGYSNLYALNATNGNEIWMLSGYGRLAAQVSNGLLYTISEYNYSLRALDASNGKIVWSYTTDSIMANSPVIAGKTLYLSSGQNFYALDALTGAKLWNYSTTKSNPSDTGSEWYHAALDNGIVYVFSIRERNLIALKASTGAKLWNYSDAGGDPPVVENGIVYVSMGAGFGSKAAIFALNAYSGEKIWNYSVQPNPPIYGWYKLTVAQNLLYYTDSLAIYALELPSPPSPAIGPNLISGVTDSGRAINLTITGNITSSQVSNVYVTNSNNTSTIYLTIAGPSGNHGFSNITIPKSLVYSNIIPTIFIDDQIAQSQGYTQNIDNYYIWYTTDFSTHKVSIIFNEKTPNVPEPFPFSSETLVLIVVPLISALSVLFLLYRRHRKQVNEEISLGK